MNASALHPTRNIVMKYLFQQFKLHALLQFRYVDPRLVFKEVSPKRKEPIMGEVSLRDALWVPHIFLGKICNEQK